MSEDENSASAKVEEAAEALRQTNPYRATRPVEPYVEGQSALFERITMNDQNKKFSWRFLENSVSMPRPRLVINFALGGLIVLAGAALVYSIGKSGTEANSVVPASEGDVNDVIGPKRATEKNGTETTETTVATEGPSEETGTTQEFDMVAEPNGSDSSGDDSPTTFNTSTTTVDSAGFTHIVLGSNDVFQILTTLDVVEGGYVRYENSGVDGFVFIEFDSWDARETYKGAYIKELEIIDSAIMLDNAAPITKVETYERHGDVFTRPYFGYYALTETTLNGRRAEVLATAIFYEDEISKAAALEEFKDQLRLAERR